jgi:hypothetical protein
MAEVQQIDKLVAGAKRDYNTLAKLAAKYPLAIDLAEVDTAVYGGALLAIKDVLDPF